MILSPREPSRLVSELANPISPCDSQAPFSPFEMNHYCLLTQVLLSYAWQVRYADNLLPVLFLEYVTVLWQPATLQYAIPARVGVPGVDEL